MQNTAREAGKRNFSEYEDVIEAVRARNPRGTDFHVGSVQKNAIQNHDLLWVFFTEENGTGVINFVLRKGSQFEIFRNDNLLREGIFKLAAKPNVLSVLFGNQVITGFIAVSFVICIIYIVLSSNGTARIPEVLSSGFALVLGFYFGRSSGPRDS